MTKCHECNDTGYRDSGGTHPWGEPIYLACDCKDAEYWKAQAEKAQREADGWKQNFQALQQALVGETGASGITVAHQLRKDAKWRAKMRGLLDAVRLTVPAEAISENLRRNIQQALYDTQDVGPNVTLSGDPHATDHRHACTGSNEPGQRGSLYGGYCAYPNCNCPFDAPADPTWCAKGLPHAPTE